MKRFISKERALKKAFAQRGGDGCTFTYRSADEGYYIYVHSEEGTCYGRYYFAPDGKVTWEAWEGR
ncbi:MAG: hypothetical protein DDT21_02643 [Syntrophomonadaceae bacterium]|nr:hypothetical protein [Bacillota bacterium]